MKDTLNWWLLLLSMTFVAACSDGGEDIEEPAPKPTPSQPAITLDISSSDFTTDGGSNTISFTASESWTAEVLNSRSDAWCSVSPTSGKAGEAEITVTTTPNDTPDNRSASIILKAGSTQKTITVSQKQKDALTVTSDKFEVGAEGGEVKIEVKANIDFEYTISEKAKSWITSADSRALKTSTLVFNVSENEDMEKREGSITISSGAFKETVTVYQEGTEPVITLTQNEFVVPSAGDVIAVEVKSNVDVEVELPAEAGWLSEDKSRAMSTNTYYFIVAESGEYDQREALIKFTNKKNELSETVKVVQVQKDAIVVAKNSYTVDNEGDEITIEVGHNIDFDIEIADEWITRKEAGSRAFVTEELVFTVVKNEGYDNRESSIKFISKDGNITQTVKVYQAQKNALVVSKKDIVVGEGGGEIEIEIQSNIEYTVINPEVDWLHSIESRALTSRTLKYMIDANTTYDSREAKIIVTNEANQMTDTIFVAQAQKDAIVVAKNEYEIGLEGGTLDFEIQTNVDFTIEVSEDAQSWITHVESRALESKTLHFDIAPCPSDERIGIITLTGGDAMQTITIKQGGLSAVLEAEREALIAFYKATGGESWTNSENWCSDKSVSEWYGIITNELGLVTGMHLSCNNLTGILPETIGNLTELNSFYVYENNLTGSIPKSIGNLKNLVNINLDLTKLTGELPESIGNLTKLKDFSAIGNNLTGSIPESIGNLINLESLYMSGNKLTGELPKSIGNLTKLHILDLSYNSLTGTIPESVSRMTDLKTFNVRSNYFTGTVPERLMKLDAWPTNWHEILDQKGEGFSCEDLVIPAPKFSENTIEGEALDYSVYSEKKYTILYHYFDWCNWSYEFTPILIELYNGYKNKGLEVIAFSGEGTIESHKEFAKTFNTKWPYITLTNNKDLFNAHTWISPGICVVDNAGYIVFNNLTEDRYDLGKFLLEKLGEPDSSDPSDVPQFYESIDYSKDGEVKQLQAATKGKGIDIVLMGDAFSDRLIADGTYDQNMQTAMEKFFEVEPYKSFRNHFNVYSITAVSKNEIYSPNSETVFKGYFGTKASVVGGDDVTVFSYALKAIGEERMDEALIVVMMNSMEYAGTCYMYGTSYGDWSNGTSISYFPVGTDDILLSGLIHHEAGGHGFAKLADEYEYFENGHIPNEEVEYNKTTGQYGWWKNVDFTNDLSQIKWSKFINDSRYANEGLGAYEGGLTYWSGVWRPTENSIMRYNTGGFNAPSREAIYYRIHKLAYGADWQYDYEKFVEWDAINRNATASRSFKYVEVPKKFKPLHAPVVKRQSWKDAK